MSNNIPLLPPQQQTRKRGVDALLTTRGKSLKIGDRLAFRLVKGPSGITAGDPVDPKAPPEHFPLLAKFPESVVKPNFGQMPWKSGRLYQQDIPKAEEDSDEEEAADNPKKRWKFNRRRNKEQLTPRQWILQEEVDFLETMVKRREQQKRSSGEDDNNKIENQLSSRYEGVPEHNASQYIIFRLPPQDEVEDDEDETEGNNATAPVVQLCTVPQSNATIAFAQPAARKGLTLSQAEQAISDQRSGIRSNLLQRADANGTNSSSEHSSAAASSKPPMLRLPSKKPADSKSRLLNRLKAVQAKASPDDADEADDIMSDITFKHRKGQGAASRKELLSTLGDGVVVSEEGVLGGGNDAVFGRGQRFGEIQSADLAKSKGDGEEGGANDGVGVQGNTEKSADGLAMADDFYQRDVKAEYDELDYDAEEQFDDDDVDLGESEVMVDNSGFGGEDEEDEDLDDAELDDENLTGAEGLASLAGFKLLLAKARGEAPAQPADGDAANAAGQDSKLFDKRSASPNYNPQSQQQKKRPQENDHMAKIMEAAQSAAKKAEDKRTAKEDPEAVEGARGPEAVAPPAKQAAIQVDENGLRIITLDAVRHEIWLNHGSMAMKRLVKIFDVKKKAGADRPEKFRQVIKELCNMTTDPVGGRMLVLKQHYANMG